MHSLFEGCDDADARILLLQEFFGASICGLAPRFQKCLVLHGPGGNGKSQVLAVLEGLLPPNTVVHIPPSRFEEEYWLAKLAGGFSGRCSQAAHGAEELGCSARSGATSASPWRTPAGNKRSGSLTMARSKNGPHVPITGTPLGPRGGFCPQRTAEVIVITPRNRRHRIYPRRWPSASRAPPRRPDRSKNTAPRGPRR